MKSKFYYLIYPIISQNNEDGPDYLQQIESCFFRKQRKI